jgi:uncharacterized protein (DUF427 family)
MAHITVTPATERVTVTAGGVELANSTNALVLAEGSYPPVHYIPKSDIEMARLTRTATASHCPHKGDASYWSVDTDDGVIADAGWSYDQPFAGVAQIAEHIAFYPNKVRIETA